MTILVETGASRDDNAAAAATGPPRPSAAQLPTYVDRAADNDDSFAKVVKAVLKAKRIAVVCGPFIFYCSFFLRKREQLTKALLLQTGAGISCASGIPDFRSGEGLFKSLKAEYPGAGLSSGRDLFDASVYTDEASPFSPTHLGSVPSFFTFVDVLTVRLFVVCRQRRLCFIP
jgi:hypothetical protein